MREGVCVIVIVSGSVGDYLRGSPLNALDDYREGW